MNASKYTVKVSTDYEPNYYNDSDYVTYIELLYNSEPVETHTARPVDTKQIEYWVNAMTYEATKRNKRGEHE